MKIHANARTTEKTRADLVDQVIRQGKTKAETARAFGTTPTTVAKWVERYLREGPEGLRDRSSAPHRVPRRTPERRARRIAKLRQQGLCAWQIAERLRMALSTVTNVLRRLGLGRGWDRKREPVIRYEWPKPGDLLHIDIKKLGKFRTVGHRITGQRRDRSRGMGWEFVYVCVDDASRLAYVEVLENEQAITATGFLERALRWFKRRGVRARRVMTDNGSPFVSTPLDIGALHRSIVIASRIRSSISDSLQDERDAPMAVRPDAAKRNGLAESSYDGPRDRPTAERSLPGRPIVTTVELRSPSRRWRMSSPQRIDLKGSFLINLHGRRDLEGDEVHPSRVTPVA